MKQVLVSLFIMMASASTWAAATATTFYKPGNSEAADRDNAVFVTLNQWEDGIVTSVVINELGMQSGDVINTIEYQKAILILKWVSGNNYIVDEVVSLCSRYESYVGQDIKLTQVEGYLVVRITNEPITLVTPSNHQLSKLQYVQTKKDNGCFY